MSGKTDFNSITNIENFKDTILSCSVCLDIFQKPVVCSSCGNSFCENCFLDVKCICPLCRNNSSYSPNAALEYFLSNMPMQCKCGKFITPAEKANHQDFCPCFEKICFYCEFKGNLEQRTIHGIYEHSDIIRDRYLLYKG